MAHWKRKNGGGKHKDPYYRKRFLSKGVAKRPWWDSFIGGNTRQKLKQETRRDLQEIKAE